MSEKISEDGTFSNDGFVRSKGEGRPPRVTRPKTKDLALPEGMPLAASKRAGNGAAPRKTKLAGLGITNAVLENGRPE